jgi:hypothetical protein
VLELCVTVLERTLLSVSLMVKSFWDDVVFGFTTITEPLLSVKSIEGAGLEKGEALGKVWGRGVGGVGAEEGESLGEDEETGTGGS